MKKKHRQPQSQDISKSLRRFILSVSFLEGGAVMFAELIGAKLVAPFFGTSLYVWASAIGITLGSLAVGYFSGGYISKKIKSLAPLFWLLLIAGGFLLLMPVTAGWIMEKTINMSIQTGVSISMLLFLAPPLILFGMISPVIIKTLTKEANNAGRVSGLVYSISTLGGIIFTYLTGFYILPYFGIRIPTLIFGSLLVLLALISLLLRKKYLALIPFGALLLIFPYKHISGHTVQGSSNYRILHESEGILGQIRVVDHPYRTTYRGVKKGRGMLVNNTCQTIMDVANPEYSLWDYAFFFPAAASIYPKGSDALILGMGGGTLLKQYDRLGFNTEVAELDQRIKDLSVKYFNVPEGAAITIDDARHFLNTTDKKFDVITFDLFLSETPPAHLLTIECFRRVSEMMNKGGMLTINFYGFTSGKTGLAARCVFKTLEQVFPYTRMLVTPSRSELSRNLIFIAGNTTLDFTNTNYSEPDLPNVSNLEEHFLPHTEMDLSDAVILTDDRPLLEHLYANAALEWRIASNVMYTKVFMNNE